MHSTTRALLLLLCLICGYICSSSDITVGSWGSIRAHGAIPLERLYPGCAATSTHLYVYGGRTGMASFTNSFQKFEFSTNTWKRIYPQLISSQDSGSPPTLSSQTMTPISEKEFLIWGGRKGLFSYANDLFIFNVDEETLKLVTIDDAIRPKARQSHASVFHDGNLYIFGGAKDRELFGDLWAFNVNSRKWKSITPSGSVKTPALEGHTATVANDKLYVFGGRTLKQQFNTKVYVYDFARNEWKILRGVQCRPRMFHTATLVGNYIYLIGGVSPKETQLVEEVQVFQTLSEQFAPYKVSGDSTSARKGHCAVENGRNIYVFAGTSSTRWSNLASSTEMMILDTAPDSRKSLANSLPVHKRISSLILNVNAEFGSSNRTSEVERKIRKLTAPPEEEDTFKHLPKKINDWKEVERLYTQVLHSRSNAQEMISNVQVHVDNINRTSSAFESIREQLLSSSGVAEQRAKLLPEHEEALEEAKKFVQQAKSDQLYLRGTRVKIEKELHDRKFNVSKIDVQVQSAQSKVHHAEKRLHDHNSILVGSDQELNQTRTKVEQIVEDLEKLGVECGNFTKNLADIKAEIQRLNEEKDKIQNKLKIYEKYQKDTAELMKRFAETSDQSTTLQDLHNAVKEDYHAISETSLEDFLKFELNLDSQKFSKSKAQIEEMIHTLQRKIDDINKRIQELVDLLKQYHSRERDCEGRRKQLHIKKESLDKRIQHIEDTRKHSTNIRKELDLKLEAAKEELDRASATQKQNSQKMSELTKQIADIISQEKEAEAIFKKYSNQEDSAQKALNKLRLELEDVYTDLLRRSKEARSTSSQLSQTRSEIDAQVELFDEHTKKVNDARSRLLAKLSEMDRDLMDCRKQVEQLKKQLQDAKKSTKTPTVGTTPPQKDAAAVKPTPTSTQS